LKLIGPLGAKRAIRMLSGGLMLLDMRTAGEAAEKEAMVSVSAPPPVPLSTSRDMVTGESDAIVTSPVMVHFASRLMPPAQGDGQRMRWCPLKPPLLADQWLWKASGVGHSCGEA
jgi:hypothetical protein